MDTLLLMWANNYCKWPWWWCNLHRFFCLSMVQDTGMVTVFSDDDDDDGDSDRRWWR